MDFQNKKVAIVHEAMFAPGGGDRFLLAISKIFDEPTVFTPFFNVKAYKSDEWEALKDLDIRSWKKRLQSKMIYNIIAPIYFEQLNLDSFDLVISIHAKFAKSVITNLDCKHVNIYLTPAGYIWNADRRRLLKEDRGILHNNISNIITSFYRIWDVVATKRADHNFSISNYISRQVKNIYGINTEIIYPPIKDFWFEDEKTSEESGSTLKGETGVLELLGNRESYFLVVSRLYDYKRIDIAINACKELGKNLVVVGQGPEESNLKSLFKKEDGIRMMGYVSDKKLKTLYRNAEALLFCGEEDYGLIPVEAMASGCPVIAFNKGGVKDTVLHGETGYFFNNYSELVEVIKNHDKSQYSKKVLINRAREFDYTHFKDKFVKLLKNI